MEQGDLYAGDERFWRMALGGSAGLSEHAQEQICDESDVYLDFDGVFAAAQEALDFEVLLNPLEQQFDLPALLVEGGYLGCGACQIVGDEAHRRLALTLDEYLAQRRIEQEVPGTATRRGMADPDVIIFDDAFALDRTRAHIAPPCVGF